MSFVALVCVLNVQLPVIRRLEFEWIAWIAAVQRVAERYQMQLIAFASHPRDLVSGRKSRRISRVVCDELENRIFPLTIFSPKFWTRQWRFTSLPSCVVSLSCACSSSKNGYGSWCVVVSSTSSSRSSSSSSASDDMLCQNFGTSKPNDCEFFGTGGWNENVNRKSNVSIIRKMSFSAKWIREALPTLKRGKRKKVKSSIGIYCQETWNRDDKKKSVCSVSLTLDSSDAE